MMGDLSLVLFTVLSQMAAGATVALWLMDMLGGSAPAEVGKRAVGIIISLTGVSLLISLVHLGEPLGAYKALANLSNSWLSREVSLFAILLMVQLLYYRQWQGGMQRGMVGAIASFFAICAIWASGMVYVLPARPAWNNAGPVLFFFFTAATLGPLFLAAIYRFCQAAVPIKLYGIVAAILGTGFFTYILYTTLLTAVGGPAALTGSNLITSGSFWPRMVIGWVVPLLLLGYGAVRRIDVHQWVFFLLCCALIGELMGRELFYSTVTALQVLTF